MKDGPSAGADIPKSYRRMVWAITFVLLVVLVTMALKPVDHSRPHLRIYDYFHVIGFAALIMPAAFLHPRSLLWLVPILAVFGAMIEVVQPFFGRGTEMQDLVDNIIGLAVGVVLGLVVRQLFRLTK